MVGAYPLGARPGTPSHRFAETESTRRRAFFAGPEPFGGGSPGDGRPNEWPNLRSGPELLRSGPPLIVGNMANIYGRARGRRVDRRCGTVEQAVTRASGYSLQVGWGWRGAHSASEGCVGGEISEKEWARTTGQEILNMAGVAGWPMRLACGCGPGVAQMRRYDLPIRGKRGATAAAPSPALPVTRRN